MKVVHTVLRQNIKLVWASIHGETQQTKGLDNQLVTMAATVQIQELSAFPIYLSWVSFKKNKKINGAISQFWKRTDILPWLIQTPIPLNIIELTTKYQIIRIVPQWFWCVSTMFLNDAMKDH